MLSLEEPFNEKYKNHVSNQSHSATVLTQCRHPANPMDVSLAIAGSVGE